MKTLLGLFALLHVTLLARCTPTVQIVENADPYADARAMHKALKGPGTDEKAIRHLLPYRSCDQRTAIRQAYSELYNDDITRRIARDTSGTYEQVLKDCFLCGEYLMASFFQRAITGSTDRHRKNKSVIEILVTHTDSPEKKNALLTAYQQMYGKSIEHEVKKHLGGDFENVLLEMIARDRGAMCGIDYNKAHDMAVELNKEVEFWGDHRKILDTVLNDTPFDQSNAIINEFKKLTGFDLIHVVSNKMNHEKANAYEDLIHYVVTYSNNHIEYYATRLKEATDGPGTDEQTIDRILLTHAEIDMKEIEDQFYNSYHRTVKSKIAHDTSGAYEHFLKKFLSKTDSEVKAGWQEAVGLADRENQLTQQLIQQGILNSDGRSFTNFNALAQPTMNLNAQAPPMVNLNAQGQPMMAQVPQYIYTW